MNRIFYNLTFILIFVNVIIFILEFFLPLEELFSFIPTLAFSKPWTFVTAMFLHANPTHLLFNMFALLIFGIHLESKVSSSQFSLIYFSAGILGNVGYLITAANPLIPGVGASGAIYGIMGASAILTPQAMVWASGIPMPMIMAAFFWTITEFLGLFVPSGIARGAHLGGLFLGILVGLYLRKKFSRETKLFLSRY